MVVLNRKGTLRREHMVSTLVSPGGSLWVQPLEKPFLSPDDFHVEGSAASTAIDVRTCCPWAWTELGHAP